MIKKQIFGRNIKKRVLFSGLIFISLLLCLQVFYLKPRRVVPILMYHAVNDDISSTLNVTPENFYSQMDFLRKHGYSVISLDSLVEHIKNKVYFQPKTVVITFDDGYEDNFTNAFPVLAEHNMPAIIFLITGAVSNQQGFLSWEQVRLMSRNGIDFGGHTRNDIYVPEIKEESVLWGEITGCKEDIEKKTGKTADYFCFPIGGFTEKAKEMVKKAGFKGACSTNRGNDKLNRDLYELKRIKVTNSDMNKPFHFRAKLSGYYNIFRSVKKGW
ncbi:MAG: polysaccharide deacetylase family protein [Candidatus Omnitrophota bacterium]